MRQKTDAGESKLVVFWAFVFMWDISNTVIPGQKKNINCRIICCPEFYSMFFFSLKPMSFARMAGGRLVLLAVRV